MSPETVMSIGSRALEITLLLAAPMLVVALVTGLIIGAFQAATQINEQTLSFIPKLLALALTMVVAGPWMLKVLMSYTHELFESIPNLIN
jgi:flagellar biosynthesis protein FliQ